jgi:antitoxin component YwqK of YwqJK toxin-antitoxin module
MTTNSKDEIKCTRFGYARHYDYNNIIIKVKPVSIEYSYVNGFSSRNYTIVEIYDFLTKKQHSVDNHYLLSRFKGFLYNETDAYFSGETFGDLTGIYEFYDINGCRRIYHLSNGEYHRDGDSPSEIYYHKNENIHFEGWYVNGKYHRDGDLPTQIHYDENGNKEYEEWSVNGQCQRDGDLPAVIGYYENGNKRNECWFVNGQRHRDGDLPAEITYDEIGDKIQERWYINNKLRRADGKPPAVFYDQDGQCQTDDYEEIDSDYESDFYISDFYVPDYDSSDYDEYD